MLASLLARAPEYLFPGDIGQAWNLAHNVSAGRWTRRQQLVWDRCLDTASDNKDLLLLPQSLIGQVSWRFRTMDEGKVFLQFGCGWSAPAGWLNYDSSPTLRFERIPLLGGLYTKNNRRFPEQIIYGDIVKGLPHADNSVHAIYASHVLEHLSVEDCRIALRHVYAMLRPQGVFRLVVPDLQWRAALYVANFQAGKSDASDQFMRSCTLGAESRPKGVLGKAAVVLGGSAHLWMWDELSMTRELTSAGFTGIRRCELGDAADPEFRIVEDETRFFDHGHAELAMEARKPG